MSRAMTVQEAELVLQRILPEYWKRRLTDAEYIEAERAIRVLREAESENAK